jgi:hypothetical protein
VSARDLIRESVKRAIAGRNEVIIGGVVASTRLAVRLAEQDAAAMSAPYKLNTAQMRLLFDNGGCIRFFTQCGQIDHDERLRGLPHDTTFTFIDKDAVRDSRNEPGPDYTAITRSFA